MTSLRKHLFRRGQTGQALAILAIGFIALCAFVGIVTDVSLLFVRYSTLRRAVDAAAVAAAGQMRRAPVDPVDVPVGSTLEGEEQAASLAHMNLAARQFIEVYGLNPSNVLVETCQTQQIDYQVVDPDGGGPHGPQLRPLDAPLAEGGRLLFSYNPAPPFEKSGDGPGDDEVRRRYEQLCKENELKLVRVTAQIEAPTIFLRLLGFSTITLTESSISQTAALDVVLILDVSESMSYETTYEDWEKVRYPDTDPSFPGYFYRYVPAYVGAFDRDVWPVLINNTMEDLLTLPHPLLPGEPWFGQTSLAPGAVPATLIDPNGVQFTGPMVAYLPQGLPPGSYPHTREMCQVRVNTIATRLGIFPNIPGPLYQEYVDVFGQSWVTQRFTGDRVWRGFRPMYDSYACCNDPNLDWDFGDLACQPFKQVRSATGDFLSQLDFIRGDRVVFVTFDHTATIIDPDGDGPQRPMIETQQDFDINGNGIIETTLNERYGAETVLTEVMGVRAETTFYEDSDNNGRWDGLIDWDPDVWDPDVPGAGWTGHDYDYFQTTVFGDIYVQPYRSSCFLDRAVLAQPQVPDSYHQRRDGMVAWPLIVDVLETPTWYYDRFAPYANNYFTDDAQRGYYDSIFYRQDPPDPQAYPHVRSAEFRGGCGGGNIGSGLGRAQQALIDDGRIEGAIWLMVLLSDGASGVSDPIAQDIVYDSDGEVTNVVLNYPRIFNRLTDPDPLIGTYYDPQPGTYGAFGVCPYGLDMNDDPGAPYDGPGEVLTDDGFPYCLDENPDTRHFCSQMPIPPTVFELNDTSGIFICDDDYYDTDDYAHDWADWVALANLPTHQQSPIKRNANEQLPTIFTIGIGLDFADVNSSGVRLCPEQDWQCRKDRNISDYLGEQLLRYIADVGDNGMLDDDYWQCQMTNRLPVQSILGYQIDPLTGTITCPDKINPNWGARGPCEIQDVAPIQRGDGGFGNWMQPTTSCGNYFSAVRAGELDGIFSVIASRMFTRLSQ